nr:endonuclease/exonuclease/phosphatase family protein [Dactylosporangium thailandense]
MGVVLAWSAIALPWLGLGVPALFGIAVWRRSLSAYVAVLVCASGWLAAFGGSLLPASAAPGDLVVVQHNFSDENRDPAGTIATLMAVRPDLIGLEEVTVDLEVPLPHHVVFGTVGLWSRYPISSAAPVDIKPHGLDADWRRGLRAVVRGVVVYVVHLPSVRLDTAWRDDSAAQLGRWLAGERGPVVLMGDLNGVVEDRGLRPITARMSTARGGFAWSFPAAFPVGRIDQVMVRGGEVSGVWTLARTGSDHLPVAARVTVGGAGAPASAR